MSVNRNQRRREDKRAFWEGLPWQAVGAGRGLVVCRSWVVELDRGWYVLQGGLLETEGLFLHARCNGPYSTEAEALLQAWRWAGVAPDRADYPPAWGVAAVQLYLLGWSRRR